MRQAYFTKPYSTDVYAVRTRKWRAENPERQRALMLRQLAKRDRTSTRERRAEFKKQGLCIHHGQRPAWGTKCCLFCWDYRLIRKYGIDAGTYATLLASQRGCCKICGKNKPLRVDHCHISGQVRGLICNRCNVLVGYLETSEDGILSSVRQYLNVERLGGVA